MYTNILFLILALLLINTIPEKVHPWVESDWEAFGYSLILYCLMCCLIFFQYRLLKKLFDNRPTLIQTIVCLELLLYLIIYQYVLNAGRIFQLIPFMEGMQALNAIWELLLYLGGLAIYYSTTYVKFYSYDRHESRSAFALRKLLFIAPFALPFVVLSFIMDLLTLFVDSGSKQSEMAEWAVLFFTLAFITLMLIFLPFFIQKIWQCKSLPDSVLKDRLDLLCKRANFKHAGMKIWTVMNDHLTAGIIGIVPWLRYVMFTNRLLHESPAEHVEAILAHEIGHSARRHLLIYPFILAGMVLCAGLFFQYFSEPLMNLLEIDQSIQPNFFWSLFIPVLIFFIYAFIVIIYFRFVFGFFSRLFERQADLHVFELGVNPKNMIDALASVAPSSGGYAAPNWHHYSIKERVEFLQSCMDHPQLIQHHHRKVKIFLCLYLIIFIIGILLLNL